jgi:hypothetical protein
MKIEYTAGKKFGVLRIAQIVVRIALAALLVLWIPNTQY